VLLRRVLLRRVLLRRVLLRLVLLLAAAALLYVLDTFPPCPFCPTLPCHWAARLPCLSSRPSCPADGYVLQMHRIPRHGARDVAFFQHGVLDTSLGWVSGAAQAGWWSCAGGRVRCYVLGLGWGGVGLGDGSLTALDLGC